MHFGSGPLHPLISNVRMPDSSKHYLEHDGARGQQNPVAPPMSSNLLLRQANMTVSPLLKACFSNVLGTDTTARAWSRHYCCGDVGSQWPLIIRALHGCHWPHSHSPLEAFRFANRTHVCRFSWRGERPVGRMPLLCRVPVRYASSCFLIRQLASDA